MFTNSRAGGALAEVENQPKRRRPGRPLHLMEPLDERQKKLVADHLGLIGVHLRSRVSKPRSPTRQKEHEDLFQEGCLALMRAAQRYRPGQHGAFAAYALPRIRGAIYTALHRRFCLIQTPPQTWVARYRKVQDGPPEPVVQELTPRMQIADPSGGQAGETLRHLLRRRFEQAMRRALREVEARPWRRRHPGLVMRRVVAERLLVAREEERISLRQIARECGVSNSRASAYEKLLLGALRDHFLADPQAKAIMRIASAGPEGLNAVADESVRQQLRKAQLESFAGRFRKMARAEQAERIYSMIEHSAAAVEEVVMNLYRLTLSEDDALA
ncbi:MAG: sigma-70 family RNA polymerase sigma factor [Phycisphaerales bacterium]|nr:sigma-70 family RNA polymerase sigma factor [Phycisphaerales bacterium]